MAQSLKAARSGAGRRYVTGLIILALAAGILGALMLLHPDSKHPLPAKYASVACSLDSGSILFDGKNPFEGTAVLQKNKSVSITSAGYFGTDIYITIGDRQNPTVLEALHNTHQTESISTNVTVPVDYRTGAVSFHVYSTLLTGECSDRWKEVWVE